MSAEIPQTHTGIDPIIQRLSRPRQNGRAGTVSPNSASYQVRIVQDMPSRIQTLIASAVSVLVIAAPAVAQTGAVLSGVVRDRTGNPVPGVVLTVVDPAKPEGRVVITDERGSYFVDRLHYGTEYAVDVTHPRFRKSRVLASANEGEASVHITLHPRRNWFASVALFPLRLLPLGLAAQPRAMAVSGKSTRAVSSSTAPSSRVIAARR